MKLKLQIAALALLMAPSAAFAMGCAYGDHAKEEIAMSCAEGTTYDAETENCVPTTS